MNSNSHTRPFLVIVTLALLILPSTTMGQTVQDGFMLSTRSRSEVLQKIVHHLVNKTGQKPASWKHHEGKEIPNIEIYEALFIIKQRNITIQYFPGKEGEVSPSITFFVNDRSSQNRWSVSFNMDGTLSSGIGDSKNTIASLRQPNREENLQYWALKGDPMISSVLAWQKRK